MRTLIFIWLLLLSYTSQSQNTYTNLLDSFTNAMNSKDYLSIEPFLSADFEIKNMDKKTSLLQFYSYVNYNKPESHSIKKISISKTITNGAIDTLKGIITYQDGKTGPLEFVISSEPSTKIKRINAGWMPPFNFVTRASYVNEDIFGNDPVKNIKNLRIVDYKSYDSMFAGGYTVFFEKQYSNLVSYTLTNLIKLDSVLISFGIRNIKREHVLLLAQARSAVIVGSSSELPWTINLSPKKETIDSDSDLVTTHNKTEILDKISHTLSHEITENSLLVNYKLGSIRYRWFRDGLSELVAYTYSNQYNKKVAKEYFMESRINDAAKHKKTGHLLDWRGGGPNEGDDIGVLYGEKYIYENEVGQYGRAFKFFKDLEKQYGKAKIVILVEKIDKSRNWISREDLLNLFNKTYNSDIVKRITNY